MEPGTRFVIKARDVKFMANISENVHELLYHINQSEVTETESVEEANYQDQEDDKEREKTLVRTKVLKKKLRKYQDDQKLYRMGKHGRPTKEYCTPQSSAQEPVNLRENTQNSG